MTQDIAKDRMPPPRTLVVVETIAIVVGLGAALYVALNPSLVYAPAPRAVLFTLVSLIPALLVGSQAAAHLRLEWRGFAFTTAGASALCLALIFILDRISAPEEKIAVYKVVDEQFRGVTLEPDGALEIFPLSGALEITHFHEANTLVAIFPEQVGDCLVRVRYAGEFYQGTIAYTGSRKAILQIGEHLQLIQKPEAP